MVEDLTQEQVKELLESGACNPRNKFGAKKTKVDGIIFDSGRESRRYSTLKLMEKLDQISNLRTQVTYRIVVNNFHVCDYRADFVYSENDKVVVEDSKGHRTPEYILKKNLMKAVLGIDILET